MLKRLFRKRNKDNENIKSKSLREETIKGDNSENKNENVKSSIVSTRQLLLTKIEQAKSDLRMSVKTQSDEVTMLRVIEGTDYFTGILEKLDSNNRCVNYNSKGLLAFAGYISTYFDNEDLKMALYLFINKHISWGEFVEFMHKFSSALRFSDEFYNSALEYIELILEFDDINNIMLRYKYDC